MGEKRKLRKRTYYAWIASRIRKGAIPLKIDKTLGNNEVTVHFDYIETGRGFIKYYLITKWPDYIDDNVLDMLRLDTMNAGIKGVRFNYYMFGEPHVIQWDSPEMLNRINAWRRYTEDAGRAINVFDYRESKANQEQKMRLINSTMYLNRAELDQRRTMCKVTTVIQITCDHDKEAVVRCNSACKLLEERSRALGFKLKLLGLNMVDWMKFVSPFSFRQADTTTGSIIKKVITDDIAANMHAFKQGRIGSFGTPMGLDIRRKETVLYKFKLDPNKAENWLISAATGGGKSYFVKSILMWLLAEGFVVTIMDYEGDEYSVLEEIIAEESPRKVKAISMGKGSSAYVDPMRIPDITGDPDIDDDLKDTAINFAVAMFRIMVRGATGELSRWEDSVISLAISQVFDEYGVTDDKETWCKSKDIMLIDVYENIKGMVQRKVLLDEASDNVKHKAAVEILEACSPYFEEGGSKAGTFKKPISVSDVQEAQLIIFRFGAKGATASVTDSTIMALKQLSVANISTQISNYCKYVKKCFNVKVWEEYQRYGEIAGSAEIIANSMTGGRKRGDVNFIITNDLSNILNSDIKINATLLQSFTAYAIGKVKEVETITKFCEKLQLKELQGELMEIARAGSTDKASKYTNAFCLILDDGKRAVVKATLPKKLASSKLFSTGVKVKQAKKVQEADM